MIIIMQNDKANLCKHDDIRIGMRIRGMVGRRGIGRRFRCLDRCITRPCRKMP